MMDHQGLDNYYKYQAGSGLASFSGSKYQRGHGFNFGRILRRLQPALKYIGKHGLRTLTNIGKDYIGGENVVESAKRNISRTGRQIANEMIEKAESYINEQNGGGINTHKKYKRRKRLIKIKRVKSKGRLKKQKSKNIKNRSKKPKSVKILRKRKYKKKLDFL